MADEEVEASRPQAPWPQAPWPQTVVRVIDTETAGHRLPDDAVIEIGSIDLDLETGEASNPMETLCDPAGVSISPGARKVHNISDEELQGAPPFAEASLPFRSATLFAAHRASFDRSRLQFPGTWLCTWKLALRAFPEQRAHGLQTLVKRLGLEPDMPSRPPAGPGEHAGGAAQPHRALYDVACTVALLRACHARLMPRCESTQDFIRRAARVAAEPALLTRLRFGKHKFEPLRDVPEDYLRWLVREPDMDVDVVFSARRELARRELVRQTPERSAPEQRETEPARTDEPAGTEETAFP